MKTLWLSAGLLTAIVLISLTLFLKGNETVSPLKCKAFSRATIDVQNGPLVFSTVENLQLYNERKEGMIHYNGYVKSPDANTYLERTIYLSVVLRSTKIRSVIKLIESSQPRLIRPQMIRLTKCG